ncbi:DUF2461 domain-containing protein [Chitinophaga sancti]|uniref:DUF2461 domain-containing protein n=1 Tax=Chitinophaga sancti TaxID=1004 RepID=A0A1K1SWK8_9BACT|nr:DUF2461 domain-containing protein [Chitinophaga sancti]WQD63139.1 DUF2461 domain-containing protein [Chitinophaga sancti]WQG91236.1 DUF2461 domain-containing protein [Chitinophaga sancti]SFW88776.1 TIGR02453 family protein [Chitinophaga sancti]
MAKQSQVILPASGFDFLQKLKKNNNREWFNENKTVYQQELQHIENFAEALLAKLNTHDLIETPSGKKSLYRIYRDTRFSNDKTPYKTHWSGSFKRATKQRRGGYYFHIEQGNSLVAGGFFGPVPADLKLIRDDISFDPAPLQKILKSKLFTSTFGQLEGEQLKTAPKGYPADHEAIDLLRFKQYLLIRRFTDEEVLEASFIEEANKTFKAMRPFFDYMSEVLTSNGNGA